MGKVEENFNFAWETNDSCKKKESNASEWRSCRGIKAQASIWIMLSGTEKQI